MSVYFLRELNAPPGDRYPHTKPFCDYLKEVPLKNCQCFLGSNFVWQQKSYKGLNKDQWLSFLEFNRTVNGPDQDFGGYDPNDPCTF